MSVWKRLPVIVRAVIAGLLVSLFGSVPWSILLQANIKAPAFPWAALVMAVYLGLLWQYLRGQGWPKSTSEARRENLRARNLSGKMWRWSLFAGAAASAFILALRLVLQRLITLPPEQVEDLSRYPRFTILLLLLTTSAVAGIVEEAAFRGYLQSPIERRHGPLVAILVSAILFGLAHFTGGGLMFFAVLPFLMAYGVLYSLLAYLTRSILPGMVLHAGQDASLLLLAWQLGPPRARPLIWEAGVDATFLWSCIVSILLGMLALLNFRKLASVTKHEAESHM